ncbi:MAG TPA: hypothetical protein VKA41_10455 [Solirubrobacterales bacterium]|nr:hypothetical protein [Solirubrobacterales bacterium]
MRRVRKHLSFANVMSVVAVFLALGGGAYAAKKLSGKSIKNNSIAKKKLKANVLKGLDTCPSNAPTNIRGICISGSQGPTDWDTANQQICRPQGLRAPTIGEALIIMTNLGSGETWTDEVTDLTNGTRGLVTAPGGPTGQIFAAPVGSSHPVRCVINATNPTS